MSVLDNFGSDDLSDIINDVSIIIESPDNYISDLTDGLNLEAYKSGTGEKLYNILTEVINNDRYLTQYDRNRYANYARDFLYAYKETGIDGVIEIDDNDDIDDEYEDLLNVLDNIYIAQAEKFGLYVDKIHEVFEFNAQVNNNIANTKGLENEYYNDYVSYLQNIINKIKDALKNSDASEIISDMITNEISKIDDNKAISIDIIISDIKKLITYLSTNDQLQIDDVDDYVQNAVYNYDDDQDDDQYDDQDDDRYGDQYDAQYYNAQYDNAQYDNNYN